MGREVASFGNKGTRPPVTLQRFRGLKALGKKELYRSTGSGAPPKSVLQRSIFEAPIYVSAFSATDL
jgi:hypothetical protein